MKSFSNITAFFIIATSICEIALSTPFSSVSCYHNWRINYTESRSVATKFQNWIYAWQHTCTRRIRPHPVPSSGIASTINEAIQWFILAMESGMIYRPLDKTMKNEPPGVWLWADSNAEHCTLHLRSLDCYLQPLSPCGVDKVYGYEMPKNTKLSEDIVTFSSSNIDSCGMAERSGKPLQWVLSHFIGYILRYSNAIKTDIDSKLVQVYGSSDPYTMVSPTYSTISVHIRGGIPDQGRQVLNVSDYMYYVDDITAKLKNTARPVKKVYLCSHVQEQNIVSSEYMTQHYPNRSFEMIVLPHTTIGKGEAQFAIETGNYNKRTASMEFFADIELLAAADYFIGSMSNIYTLVTGLRISRSHKRHLFNNQSCILDFHTDSKFHGLHCEGSEYVKNRWRKDHGGFNNPHSENDFYNPELFEWTD